MTRKILITKDPVVLDGYQAVMKPSKFGYSLSAIVNEDLISELEQDRGESLLWAETKLKNPKRCTLKPEPWEEVAKGKWKVKFSWNEETKPLIYDSYGTPVTDTDLPICAGGLVRIALYQKPYILRDGVTYGTSLKIEGIQIIRIGAKEIEDRPDIRELFGVVEGGYQVKPA